MNFPRFVLEFIVGGIQHLLTDHPAASGTDGEDAS